MATAIFSIHPQFADLILSGEKKFEFRRIPAKRDIDKILIYATAPVCAVVGEVKEMDADGIQCLLCANYVALPKRYCPYRNSDLKDFPKCFVEKEKEN